MGEEFSALPWCWVIETLARSRQVGAPILYELLSRAPLLSGKSGQKAKEIVALRCLEDFFSSSSGSIDDHPTSDPSKARFSSLDSCDDVLQRVLHENSGCDPRKNASDELKCEVRSFVELKKASLPRCSLELLKCVIVEGTHPLAGSFKEIRELALPSQYAIATPSNGIDPASTSLIVDESGHRDQAKLVEENGVSSEGISDQVERTSLPNEHSPHLKRATIDEVQEADNIMNCLDNHEPPKKKLKLDKQDGTQSQQPLISCDGSDMSNAAENGLNNHSPKPSQEHIRKTIGEKTGDLGKVNVYFDNQPSTSHDNNVHHLGEADLAKKMLPFLNTQSIFADDSPAMTDNVVNLCMNCNKGGELLTCGANACSLTFHESCLGCSASFDDQCKFYCPFCAYSRAISEYEKVKEKVSLARKELSLFVGGRISCMEKIDSLRALEEDVNQQRKNEDINKTIEPITGVNVVTNVANHRQLRSSKGSQREVPTLPASAAENASVAASVQDPSSEERLGAETIIQLAKDLTEIHTHRPDGHNTDDGNLSHEDEKISNTSQKNSNIRRMEEDAGHQATELHEGVVSDSISASDGLSEDDKNKENTSILSPKPLRKVPVSKGLRRKKVPWTAEEEEMLKKGIEKFVPEDNAAFSIPWKSILEFGSSVFQKSRTPIDLKDKWRNMSRGIPKVK